MLDTVLKSFRMLPADRRWWWAVLPGLAALTGAAEAVAAGAVFGLVKIITDPQAAASVPVAARSLRFPERFLEQTELELVSFQNQPPKGGRRVPAPRNG